MKDWSSRRDTGASRRDAERPRLQREFRAIGSVDEAGRVLSAIGELEGAPVPDAGQADRLGRGGTVLASAEGAAGSTRMFAMAPYDSRLAGRRAVAEIDPAYLWGRLPDAHRYLCRRRQGQELFLHDGRCVKALQISHRNAGSVSYRGSFEQDGITYIASHHPLVLEPEIAKSRLVSDCTRPMPALAPIAGRPHCLPWPVSPR